MKRKLVCRSFGMLLVLCCAFAMANAQAPRPSSPDKSVLGTINLPDYPQYNNSGNPQADAEQYEAQKAAWIASHQAYYGGPGRNYIIQSTPNSNGTTTYQVMMSSFAGTADDATLMDQKLGSNIAVTAVNTNPNSKVCTLTITNTDAGTFLSDHFGINL